MIQKFQLNNIGSVLSFCPVRYTLVIFSSWTTDYLCWPVPTILLKPSECAHSALPVTWPLGEPNGCETNGYNTIAHFFLFFPYKLQNDYAPIPVTWLNRITIAHQMIYTYTMYNNVIHYITSHVAYTLYATLKYKITYRYNSYTFFILIPNYYRLNKTDKHIRKWIIMIDIMFYFLMNKKNIDYWLFQFKLSIYMTFKKKIIFKQWLFVVSTTPVTISSEHFELVGNK